MEKNRKRLILLAACLFIITLLVIRTNTSLFLPSKQPFIFTLNEQDIISLTLTGEQKKQTVVKDKTKWTIKKDGQIYNADLEKVQALIKTLNGITKETIVSKNINKHIELGIGIQSIVIKTQDKNDTIYVGKEHTGDICYAKLNDEDEVFLGNGLANISLDEDFRDLKTHLLKNESQIKSISINSDEGDVLLVKKKSDWMIGDKKALINPVTYFLDNLKNLTASDIIGSSGNALDFPHVFPQVEMIAASIRRLIAAYYFLYWIVRSAYCFLYRLVKSLTEKKRPLAN